MQPSDLPPDLRRQLKAGRAKVPRPQIRAVERRTGHLPWRCHSCGVQFSSWAATERHARDARHPRIDCYVTLDDWKLRKGEGH